jgi:hypothetical protein
MVESIRDVIARELPFLSDARRLKARSVADKYAGLLGARAYGYISSILMSGIQAALKNKWESEKVVDRLVERLDECYHFDISRLRFDRDRKALLVLGYFQDRLNVENIPGYNSVFDDSSPGKDLFDRLN